MATETERKFLVKSGAYKDYSYKTTRIKQGYLSSVPERTVRVRVAGDKGWITIKGIGNKKGMSRYEWERKIPKITGEELLKICEPGVIDKTRYTIKIGKQIFEVDEFHGENQGLVVAEIELQDEHEPIPKAVWLGREITGNKKYYNSMLVKKPFTKW